MNVFLASKNTSHKTAVCIDVKWVVELLKEVSSITIKVKGLGFKPIFNLVHKNFLSNNSQIKDLLIGSIDI